MFIENSFNNYPILFGENFTRNEVEQISKIIKENDGNYFDSPIYNYWKFWKYSDGSIDCMRSSWESSTVYAKSLQEIIAKLENYYSR